MYTRYGTASIKATTGRHVSLLVLLLRGSVSCRLTSSAYHGTMPICTCVSSNVSCWTLQGNVLAHEFLVQLLDLASFMRQSSQP
jgi:hypothetical protein